jgi:SCP-2 sterol transfer family
MPHPFLSDAWLDEVKKLTDDAGSSIMPTGVQLNLVVTGSPEGDRQLHVSDGGFGAGLVDGFPTKLTIPYTVAFDMFISGDQAAAMQAFMSGQIKVEGDMSKLMSMQGQSAQGAGATAIQDKLRAITAMDD